MASFELSVEEPRARRGVKWRRFPADVLPSWVADMDFAVPDEVQEAVERVVRLRDYGYGTGHGVREGREGLAEAFRDYAKESFAWDVDPAGVLPVGDLIQGMYSSVYAFSEPGDGIVVQTPIYPPFLDTIATTERRLIENRLVDDGTKYAVDVDDLRRVMDKRTRLLMIPNPHNPTGRAFTRDELEVMAEVAIEHDLIVVSDEIHADLVYLRDRLWGFGIPACLSRAQVVDIDRVLGAVVDQPVFYQPRLGGGDRVQEWGVVGVCTMPCSNGGLTSHPLDQIADGLIDVPGERLFRMA